MKFDRTGIILYTINYDLCVSFYKDVIELDVLFETEELTCFSFGEAYLMVEKDTDFDTLQKPERPKTCLRMNVKNVKSMANNLINKGIDVDYQEHSWGVVAKFLDPDGNLCAFKDSELFEKQIQY